MSTYDEFSVDEDFMTILDYLRENCLATDCEVVDATDLEWEVVSQYYTLAQTIVAEEIDQGVIHDSWGASLAQGYIDYARTQPATDA